MSSALSFTFRPSLIPAACQAEYLTRFCQLVLDYETLTGVSDPVAPPADAVPPPSSFTPVTGDGAEDDARAVPVAKKPRKNPWTDLTEEQRAERLAAMRRGRAEKAAQRRLSEDSLNVTAPVSDPVPAPAPAPVAVVAEDAASETSSAKPARKNTWAGLTPEQREVRIGKMRAAREAKKAAAALTSSA